MVKDVITIAFNFHAEVLHDGDGHVHVGFGVEVGGEFDFNWSFGHTEQSSTRRTRN